MQTLAAITPLRAQLKSWRLEGKSIGFVPTMGNLHAGHLTLVQLARARADRVVVSVFVNPTQFGPAEDFAGYPRTLEEDKRLLVAEGVDMLFAPGVSDMYEDTEAHTARIEVPGLSDILCGAVRPGHFSGVATVVAKLFNIVQPDLAVFGEKDFQQLLVIRKLTADLNYPIEILGAPVGRESDGLAYSSRNRYLTATERETAPILRKILSGVAESLRGGRHDYQELQKNALEALAAAGFQPDYLEIREASDLRLPGPDSNDLVVLAAAYLGKARLIDNIRLNRS
ncbi:MAG: pantoate--beta-alanine ligase [Chromatiales bacterium]|jgi:pantoate--beta-alanine ligase|nr:pantoate--beta-alanine ligase [Chromatiales bacterium]MDH3930684.1 pantoate--beta-alanine ligase [Chromatiales bacterium]MDH4013468.1 pantoate--beta-alanine ligase [Chromatiales bacterium]PLX56157.1 MAG: pantoate--beta-alanine ligase [Chromatiales bacterium]